MNVYSVGEFCQHEGGRWDRLVPDNDEDEELFEYMLARISKINKTNNGE